MGEGGESRLLNRMRKGKERWLIGRPELETEMGTQGGKTTGLEVDWKASWWTDTRLEHTRKSWVWIRCRVSGLESLEVDWMG